MTCHVNDLSYTQQILATLAPDWQLPVVAILAIVHWDTGFGATTGPQYGRMHLLASLAIASLDQNGTTHWHLPLWPQLAIVIGAQSGCHMVIYGYLLLFYFLYKNEMIRWFPCGTWHHSGSFIVMKVWGCIIAGIIFSFCYFYQNYLFWNNCFLDGSMWFLLFLAPLC